MRILLLSISLLLGINCWAQKIIPAKKLKVDFNYLVQELRDKHQGLYQYIDTAAVDQTLDSLRHSIQTPMDKLAFYQLVLKVIGLTNEGHTSADLPYGTMLKVGLSKSFLPLALKYCDGHYIITQNFGAPIPNLTKGDRLVAIDGVSMEALLEELLPLIPTDGFNQTSAYEWMGGFNFTLLYRLVFGKKDSFEVSILKPENKGTETFKIQAIRYKQFKSRNAQFVPRIFNYSQFQYEVIGDSTAYLSVPGFGEDRFDYEEYYKSIFQQIKKDNIQHLILDIQDNGGGEEGNENLLFSYLSKTPLQKYKQVTMLPIPYQQNQNDRGLIFDQWKLNGKLAQRGNFTLQSNYYSELGYQHPDSNLVFDGHLYVLIGGQTFSGGAEFASMIRMSNRGVFIGEEVGGAYEGNVSGYYETIKLPHSKIKVHIPSVHFQMNVLPQQKGIGVLPDHEVPQSWKDYLTTRNSKLEFAKQLIRK